MPAEPSPKASAQAKTLLIADDEPNIRRVLQAIFTKDGYEVHVAENGIKAMEWASANPVHVLITDLIMPDMNGVELIQKVKGKAPGCGRRHDHCLCNYQDLRGRHALSAHRITSPSRLTWMRFGPSSSALSIRAAETQAANSGTARSAGRTTPSLLANAVSPAMQEILTTVSRAAASRATVLIRGESGTGKELVARALHEQSDRADGPFVPISCAALSETLLESELFGHEKNAFTGAAAEKKGRFETGARRDAVSG